MLHKRIMDPADNGVEKCEHPSSSNALAAPPGQRLGVAIQSPAQLRRGGGRKFLVLSPLLGMGNSMIEEVTALLIAIKTRRALGALPLRSLRPCIPFAPPTALVRTARAVLRGRGAEPQPPPPPPRAVLDQFDRSEGKGKKWHAPHEANTPRPALPCPACPAPGRRAYAPRGSAARWPHAQCAAA